MQKDLDLSCRRIWIKLQKDLNLSCRRIWIKLQKDLDTLGEWAVENGTKINPGKSKAIRFVTARLKNPLVTKKFPEASSCKYLGMILRSD